MIGSRAIGRIAAIAVGVLALAGAALVLLGAGGDPWVVHARFASAAQLVKGDQVEVAGVAVGSITQIELTDDGQADVELSIDDAGHIPLHRGVQATIRQASLSGVANRYVELRLPPGGAPEMAEGEVIPQRQTTTAVDLDQVFNTFDPKTRKALSGFIQGQSRAYAGEGDAANAGLAYLNPNLVASSRLVRELDRDTPTLVGFLDNSSRLVTDVAARRQAVTGLVSGISDTTNAIADRSNGLDQTLVRLAPFMRRADTTFANLRSTLDDVDPAVAASKPLARKLRPLLALLRPTARDARPTLRSLAQLVQRPGASNDLVDLTRSNARVADLALRDQTVGGATREGTFPATARALKASTPELAYVRPYAVDLTGWFDDFAHSGIVDALGGASRAAPHVNAFAVTNGLLKPLLTPETQQLAYSQASIGQRNRCPGAAERGSAWKPTPDYNCDLSQVPLGP